MKSSFDNSPYQHDKTNHQKSDINLPNNSDYHEFIMLDKNTHIIANTFKKYSNTKHKAKYSQDYDYMTYDKINGDNTIDIITYKVNNLQVYQKIKNFLNDLINDSPVGITKVKSYDSNSSTFTFTIIVEKTMAFKQWKFNYQSAYYNLLERNWNILLYALAYLQDHNIYLRLILENDIHKTYAPGNNELKFCIECIINSIANNKHDILNDNEYVLIYINHIKHILYDRSVKSLDHILLDIPYDDKDIEDDGDDNHEGNNERVDNRINNNHNKCNTYGNDDCDEDLTIKTDMNNIGKVNVKNSTNTKPTYEHCYTNGDMDKYNKIKKEDLLKARSIVKNIRLNSYDNDNIKHFNNIKIYTFNHNEKILYELMLNQLTLISHNISCTYFIQKATSHYRLIYHISAIRPKTLSSAISSSTASSSSTIIRSSSSSLASDLLLSASVTLPIITNISANSISIPKSLISPLTSIPSSLLIPVTSRLITLNELFKSSVYNMTLNTTNFHILLINLLKILYELYNKTYFNGTLTLNDILYQSIYHLTIIDIYAKWLYDNLDAQEHMSKLTPNIMTKKIKISTTFHYVYEALKCMFSKYDNNNISLVNDECSISHNDNLANITNGITSTNKDIKNNLKLNIYPLTMSAIIWYKMSSWDTLNDLFIYENISNIIDLEYNLQIYQKYNLNFIKDYIQNHNVNAQFPIAAGIYAGSGSHNKTTSNNADTDPGIIISINSNNVEPTNDIKLADTTNNTYDNNSISHSKLKYFIRYFDIPANHNYHEYNHNQSHSQSHSPNCHQINPIPNHNKHYSDSHNPHHSLLWIHNLHDHHNNHHENIDNQINHHHHHHQHNVYYHIDIKYTYYNVKISNFKKFYETKLIKYKSLCDFFICFNPYTRHMIILLLQIELDSLFKAYTHVYNHTPIQYSPDLIFTIIGYSAILLDYWYNDFDMSIIKNKGYHYILTNNIDQTQTYTNDLEYLEDEIDYLADRLIELIKLISLPETDITNAGEYTSANTYFNVSTTSNKIIESLINYQNVSVNEKNFENITQQELENSNKKPIKNNLVELYILNYFKGIVNHDILNYIKNFFYIGKKYPTSEERTKNPKNFLRHFGKIFNISELEPLIRYHLYGEIDKCSKFFQQYNKLNQEFLHGISKMQTKGTNKIITMKTMEEISPELTTVANRMTTAPIPTSKATTLTTETTMPTIIGPTTIGTIATTTTTSSSNNTPATATTAITPTLEGPNTTLNTMMPIQAIKSTISNTAAATIGTVSRSNKTRKTNLILLPIHNESKLPTPPSNFKVLNSDSPPSPLKNPDLATDAKLIISLPESTFKEPKGIQIQPHINEFSKPMNEALGNIEHNEEDSKAINSSIIKEKHKQRNQRNNLSHHSINIKKDTLDNPILLPSNKRIPGIIIEGPKITYNITPSVSAFTANNIDNQEKKDFENNLANHNNLSPQDIKSLDLSCKISNDLKGIQKPENITKDSNNQGYDISIPISQQFAFTTIDQKDTANIKRAVSVASTSIKSGNITLVNHLELAKSLSLPTKNLDIKQRSQVKDQIEDSKSNQQSKQVFFSTQASIIESELANVVSLNIPNAKSSSFMSINLMGKLTPNNLDESNLPLSQQQNDPKSVKDSSGVKVIRISPSIPFKMNSNTEAESNKDEKKSNSSNSKEQSESPCPNNIQQDQVGSQKDHLSNSNDDLMQANLCILSYKQDIIKHLTRPNAISLSKIYRNIKCSKEIFLKLINDVLINFSIITSNSMIKTFYENNGAINFICNTDNTILPDMLCFNKALPGKKNNSSSSSTNNNMVSATSMNTNALTITANSTTIATSSSKKKLGSMLKHKNLFSDKSMPIIFAYSKNQIFNHHAKCANNNTGLYRILRQENIINNNNGNGNNAMSTNINYAPVNITNRNRLFKFKKRSNLKQQQQQYNNGNNNKEKGQFFKLPPRHDLNIIWELEENMINSQTSERYINSDYHINQYNPNLNPNLNFDQNTINNSNLNNNPMQNPLNNLNPGLIQTPLNNPNSNFNSNLNIGTNSNQDPNSNLNLNMNSSVIPNLYPNKPTINNTSSTDNKKTMVPYNAITSINNYTATISNGDIASSINMVNNNENDIGINHIMWFIQHIQTKHENEYWNMHKKLKDMLSFRHIFYYPCDFLLKLTNYTMKMDTKMWNYLNYKYITDPYTTEGFLIFDLYDRLLFPIYIDIIDDKNTNISSISTTTPISSSILTISSLEKRIWLLAEINCEEFDKYKFIIYDLEGNECAIHSDQQQKNSQIDKSIIFKILEKYCISEIRERCCIHHLKNQKIQSQSNKPIGSTCISSQANPNKVEDHSQNCEYLKRLKNLTYTTLKLPINIDIEKNPISSSHVLCALIEEISEQKNNIELTHSQLNIIKQKLSSFSVKKQQYTQKKRNSQVFINDYNPLLYLKSFI